ncbi:MAG: prepilin-type N-terminal cleavage/methylation domain-containing protein [Phycisphaerales bacterium]|nr:prepilin-type N-terminal cleavage/methylation domain-containing protein [Phycisphaerales bacterium]
MIRALGVKRRAFSLIELVIVVVIIGIIGAIAIPRMSRGAAGASDSALTANLAVLRNAIDLFQSEHGGAYPTAGGIVNELTLYTDATGATSATQTGAYIYGPYLRAVPPLPVGAKKGSTGIAAADGAGVGWIYTAATGKINANTTTEADASGKLYAAY